MNNTFEFVYPAPSVIHVKPDSAQHALFGRSGDVKYQDPETHIIKNGVKYRSLRKSAMTVQFEDIPADYNSMSLQQRKDWLVRHRGEATIQAWHLVKDDNDRKIWISPTEDKGRVAVGGESSLCPEISDETVDLAVAP